MLALLLLWPAVCPAFNVQVKALYKSVSLPQEPGHEVLYSKMHTVSIELKISNTEKSGEKFLLISQVWDAEKKRKSRLLTPLALKMRQERATQNYPFHFITAVNGRMDESIFNRENTLNFTGCSREATPCKMDIFNGTKVTFSEGFCCECYGNMTRQSRGNQSCEGFDLPGNKKQMAMFSSGHCLVPSEVWYTVNSMGHPNLYHSLYIQVFQKELESGGKVLWHEMTKGEQELGTATKTKRGTQFTTVAMTYEGEDLHPDLVLLPFKTHRLLIPFPMSRAEDNDKFPQISDGAQAFMISPAENFNVSGRHCDLAGVSHHAFYNQPSRCLVPAGTCLHNQPLDWYDEDYKARLEQRTGQYLLPNFGEPNKDGPILINRMNNQRWLVINHQFSYRSVAYLDISSPNLTVLRPGLGAQIMEVYIQHVEDSVEVHVDVLNTGLVPEHLCVEVEGCSHTVSTTHAEELMVYPRQEKTVVISVIVRVDAPVFCTAVVKNSEGIAVAERKFKIKPQQRCFCHYICKCVCMDESQGCVLVSQAEYNRAGFTGTLPSLPQPQHHAKKRPKPPLYSLIILAVILILLGLGLLKALIGLCFTLVEEMGIRSLIYMPVVIDSYLEPRLKYCDVVYSKCGYPVDPYTKEKVRVLRREVIFLINVLFFLMAPFLLIYYIIRKSKKKRKKCRKSGGGFQDKRADQERDFLCDSYPNCAPLGEEPPPPPAKAKGRSPGRKQQRSPDKRRLADN